MSLLAATLAVSAPASASGLYDAPRAQPAATLVYLDEPVSEVPNAVAVANDGTIVASLFDAQAVAVVKGPGDVVTVELRCSPADVAIHPDATLAWAVCPGDPHLWVIDMATGEVAIAGLELMQADDVAYLPGPDRLVIADLGGQILLTTGHDGYEVVRRISTGDRRPMALAPLADGSRTYAVTDIGQLIAVDFGRGTVSELRGFGANTFLTSIALSRSGTSLYATADEKTDGVSRAFVLRLDPVSGEVIQRAALDFTPPGFTSMGLAAGHRSLSVATGLYVDIRGNLTGTFDVAIDNRGALGDLSALLPVSYAASDVGRSADGTRIAFGITNGQVAGVIADDPPYPPSITLTGALAKGKLSLKGATTVLQPGTPLTVLIQDATKKGSAFVTQPIKAVVDARGSYTWKGKAPSKRVRVLVTGPECASPTISLTTK